MKSHIKHIPNQFFYVNEDEDCIYYLAYKLPNEPDDVEHFVLYLDDYNMDVDENQNGQDILIFDDDGEYKYIDLDNISYDETEHILRMNVNRLDNTNEIIKLKIDNDDDDMYEESLTGSDSESQDEEDEEDEEDMYEEEEDIYEEYEQPHKRIHKNKIDLRETKYDFDPEKPFKPFSFSRSYITPSLNDYVYEKLPRSRLTETVRLKLKPVKIPPAQIKPIVSDFEPEWLKQTRPYDLRFFRNES